MSPNRLHRSLSVAALLTGLVTLTACTQTVAESPEPSTTVNSANEWDEKLIEGPHKPEDLIQLSSGTVFLSGMAENPGDADGGAGSLHTMNPDTGQLTNIWSQSTIDVAHDMGKFGECPGSLDPAVASPHGLGTETAEDGTEYLYVVNHGGRESIEVFEVNGGNTDTRLTWVGCSILSEGSMGNGVVADPSGDGFYVTNFLDPADMEGNFEKAFANEPTGEVLHWTPESGWATVPGSEMSTPNGIAVSEDGKSLYVASWGGRELVELDMATGEQLNSVALEFMPDNLRFMADGRLLVTGQVIDSFDTFMGYEFGELQPEERYDVYALSTDSFTVEPVAEGNIAGFGNPTTALEVGERIFVGSVAGDKILQLER
ncbi:YncE family protein [Corynebacterium sp. A21]|uniref:YncE family protein n=1 Tax=Corynebacterium sp. A21 TaxID=3457318 RepID=UPI003FD0380A